MNQPHSLTTSYGDSNIDLQPITVPHGVNTSLDISPHQHYQQLLEQGNSSIFLTQSSFQLDECLELLQLAQKQRRPILFIVRDEYTKNTLRKFLAGKATQKNEVYVESIGALLEDGGIYKGDQNIIVSIFDIPKIGKNNDTERNFLRFLHEKKENIDLFFSNFSNTFSSNPFLKDFIPRANKTIINSDNNVQNLQSSHHYGTLTIKDLGKKESKEEEYTACLKEYENASKPSLFVVNTKENASQLKKEVKNEQVIIINEKSIDQVYSEKIRITNYDIVIIVDSMIGFLDITQVNSAIIFDRISDDKLRKTAKQLLISGGNDKQIFSPQHLCQRIEETTLTKPNELRDLSIISPTVEKNGKAKGKKQENKMPSQFHSRGAEIRLGILPNDLSRVDETDLLYFLKENYDWHQKVSEILASKQNGVSNYVETIPALKELLKRRNQTYSRQPYSYFIEWIKNLRLLKYNDQIKIQDEFPEKIKYPASISNDELRNISKIIFGEKYEDSIRSKVKEELSQIGINNHFDILAQGNIGKRRSKLFKKITETSFINLYIHIFIDKTHPSTTYITDLPKISQHLYKGNISNSDIFDLTQKVSEEIVTILSALKSLNQSPQKRDRTPIGEGIDSAILLLEEQFKEFLGCGPESLKSYLGKRNAPYFNLFIEKFHTDIVNDRYFSALELKEVLKDLISKRKNTFNQK